MHIEIKFSLVLVNYLSNVKKENGVSKTMSRSCYHHSPFLKGKKCRKKSTFNLPAKRKIQSKKTSKKI